ncbi:MAG: PQQ-dependent sugar dehydrogenase, partial [Opitutales bacterium]
TPHRRAGARAAPSSTPPPRPTHSRKPNAATQRRNPTPPTPPATVTEYLDLRDYPELQLRTASGEQGFHSFAFHPDFHKEGAAGYGRFYTIHSSDDTSATPDFDPGGSTVFHTLLLEWNTDTPESGEFAPIDGEPAFREILRFKQPYGNHNAGLVAFNPTADTGDPDYGNLYVALGDGGSGGDPQENGQDPSNPYGAILRIDPLGDDGANGRYGIVADNALAADGSTSTLAEIFCYGLRNPQRFGWDPETGEMYIADIGQNAVEEINLGANGANFGWDDREGNFAFESNQTAGLTDSVAEYDHTDPVADMPATIGKRAVTVGEVARGSGIAGMDGLLPFGDFPTGLIFLLDVDSDPLDGGQDGIEELKPLTPEGTATHLLDLINAARTAHGLNSSSRADLRFSVGSPGKLFILNKHDGIVRQLVPPSISISQNGDQIEIDFIGVLQESDDLATDPFEDVDPQPTSPWTFTPDDERHFFQSTAE